MLEAYALTDPGRVRTNNQDFFQIVPELGKRKNATNEKAKRVLGWAPRSNEESIVATAESLVRLGLLKDGRKG